MNSLCRIGIRDVGVNSWFSIYLDIEINTEVNACVCCVCVCVIQGREELGGETKRR